MTYIKYRAKQNLVQHGYKVYNRPCESPWGAMGSGWGLTSPTSDSRIHESRLKIPLKNQDLNSFVIAMTSGERRRYNASLGKYHVAQVFNIIVPKNKPCNMVPVCYCVC